MLNKQQLLSIFGFIALFLLLYFGCNTKTSKQKNLEKSRSNKIEIISIQKLIKESRATLVPEVRSKIDFLTSEAKQSSESDSSRVKALEMLSSEWFQLDFPIISAFYAEEIANILATEDSWSIAGTTYALAMKKSKSPDQRNYCFENAVEAFEKSISLNPEKIDHRINLALTYVDNPPEKEPMKGVLMMLDLNKQHPKNIKVLNQLGVLSIKTNQFEKAIQRFGQVLEIDSENRNANCLMAQVLLKVGREKEAVKFQDNCK